MSDKSFNLHLPRVPPWSQQTNRNERLWRRRADMRGDALNYCNHPLSIVTKWKTEPGNKKVIDWRRAADQINGIIHSPPLSFPPIRSVFCRIHFCSNRKARLGSNCILGQTFHCMDFATGFLSGHKQLDVFCSSSSLPLPVDRIPSAYQWS